jgi:hypothetical protein
MSDTAIGYIIFLFPLCCLLGWAILRIARDSLDAKVLERSIDWPEVEGKVISNVQVWSHSRVEYEYAVSTRRYTGMYTIALYNQSRFNSPAESAKEFAECLASFPPGSNILVHYNPKKPAESVLHYGREVGQETTDENHINPPRFFT